MSEFVAILIAVLTSGTLTAIVTAVLTRRKFSAEIEKIRSEREVNNATEANVFSDAIQKLTANNSVLQAANAKLYGDNVTLEKAITEQDKAFQNLTARLSDRDGQIRTLNEQLRLLQDKERQADITQALMNQQQAIIQIAETYQKIISDREKTIKELVARTGPLPEKKG